MLIQLINNSVYITILDCDRKIIRKIGYIENNVFYTRKSDRHKYDYYENFGISYKFIRYSPENLFSLICLKYSNSYFWTTRISYLHYGKIIDKNNGLEKQLQLKLSQFHKTREGAEEELRILSLRAGLDLKRKGAEIFLNMANAMRNIKEVLY